jgi:hypothetical protein
MPRAVHRGGTTLGSVGSPHAPVAAATSVPAPRWRGGGVLSLIHITEPTRPEPISFAVVGL